jgi:hypothetical protein
MFDDTVIYLIDYKYTHEIDVSNLSSCELSAYLITCFMQTRLQGKIIYFYIDKSCWIPLGIMPQTLNYNMNVERDNLKM